MYTRPNNLISLEGVFRIERKEERHKQKLHEETSYYTDAQQKLARTTINSNGQYTNQDGQILDGKYLYVSLTNFDLICSNKKNQHHSDLSNGKKVSGAGIATFNDGILTSISNESGHYKPTDIEMIPLLAHLIQATKNKDLYFEDHSQIKKTTFKFVYRANDVVTMMGTKDLSYLSRVKANKNDVSIEFDPDDAMKFTITHYEASRFLGMRSQKALIVSSSTFTTSLTRGGYVTPAIEKRPSNDIPRNIENSATPSFGLKMT